ncbi:DUF4158 domain-containing protein, partial [Rubrimonas sp.]|uniref:DUF4158 domain-containing protein n=1 Tax=Rubrimonas sp. TaxID=2036015 RepID=UPI002FDDF384
MWKDSLAAQWALSFAEMAFIEASPRATRLGFATQLKFFQINSYLPTAWEEIDADAQDWLAEQLGVAVNSALEYRFESRTGRRHGAEIKRHLGLRRLTDADRTALGVWITEKLCPTGLLLSDMLEAALAKCREDGLWVASRKVMERLVRSERRRFTDTTLARVTAMLPQETIERLELLLAQPEDGLGFHTLKHDVGSATRENV